MFDIVTVVGALYLGVGVLAAALVPLALVGAAQRQGPVNWKLPIVVALGLAAWFGVAGSVASAEGFRSAPDRFPTIVAALLVPLAVGFGALWLVEPFRRMLADPHLQPFLIAMQTYRVAGVGFLLLVVAGQLPAIFGVPAGLGDILVGLTAPGAAAALQQGRVSRAVAWNVLGLLDLALALTLGVGTGPSALHFIGATASSQALSLFPLVIAPSFVVPLDIWLHSVSLWFLLGQRPRQRQAQPQGQLAAA
jgi:hypothetical protein